MLLPWVLVGLWDHEPDKEVRGTLRPGPVAPADSPTVHLLGGSH